MARREFLLLLFPFVCVVTGSSAPALSYALTTTLGPVVPGQGIEFTATVTNLSTVPQYVALTYKVPQFTTDGRVGYPAGTTLSYTMGNVAAGAVRGECAGRGQIARPGLIRVADDPVDGILVVGPMFGDPTP